MSSKSQCQTKKPRPSLEVDLLDTYGPSKLKRILPTCTERKKDHFASFRPAKGECLDYDISQTVLRMDVGDTLINVKDVQATYVPAPPVIHKKKKEKPPPSKFINEVWMHKQNELQGQYKKDLIRYIKVNKIQARERGKTMHNIVQSLVGPEWFQELSPKQLEAVDELQCCILADIKDNRIASVQENIGKLGLAPKPKHRHFKKALRLCCKNPVEFLLILYQVINPKREEYSMNDRLLLSAVVHLTMTETLRELHVRIPSPPRTEKKQAERPKKEKRVKYSSPYLEPLIYKPYLRKHTGLYENPRIQYPESPYFAYAPALPIERLMTDDISELDLSKIDGEEAEVLKDMKRAQLEYDRIQGERVKLLRPTVLRQCEDTANFYKDFYKAERKALALPSLPTLNDSEEEQCFCSEILEADTNLCAEYEYQNCECKQRCRCSKKSQMYTSPRCRGCLSRERKKYVQRVIKGVAMLPNNTVIPIIETTLLQKTCDCLQRYQDSITAMKARNILKGQKAQYVIGGVAMTARGPTYIISTALKKSRKKAALNADMPEVVEQGKVFDTRVNSNAANMAEKNQGVDEVKERSGGDDVYCTCSSPTHIEKSSNTENIGTSCVTVEETGDTEEEDSSSPCDCCSECKCKERSKIYTSPRCNKCQEKERQKYIERIITGLKETTSHKLVPIIEGTRLLKTCDCLQSYAERILSMEARDKIQSHKAQFVIGGVVFTKMGPVYILSTALHNTDMNEICGRSKRKRSRSKESKPKQQEEEEEEEEVKYSGCKCKEELEKFLSHKCTCELCNINRRQDEATYIVGGTTSTVDGGNVNVVQGVYGQTCDCLERHKEKMDRLEQYRQRIEARFKLKSQVLKYSIGGVVNTPGGPIYIITGLRPSVDCECARAQRRKEEEELHLQQMAKMPPTGRIKYQIAGVKSTPEGNVFIISQALPTAPCDCENLYDTYIQAHTACLDAYEGFLQQTQRELEHYMAEVDVPTQLDLVDSQVTDLGVQPWDQHDLNIDTTSENSISNYNLMEHGQVVRTIRKKCGGQKLNICSRVGLLNLSEDSLFSECLCYGEEEESERDESESSDETSLESLACVDFCLQDFRTNNSAVTETERKTKETAPQLKRFVILKEMPEDPKKQMTIIRNVLAQMAEDGFPLAKLPECHKLPHFKLWMKLRLGKFWTHKEIKASQDFSKWGWCHTDSCQITVACPVLGVSKTKAANLTWRDAKYIRNLVAEKTVGFYREVSRKAVDSTREFFPLSCSYEFPNKTFRNVYFAYLPSKEQDTLAFRIVKPHDTRIIAKKYSCNSSPF